MDFLRETTCLLVWYTAVFSVVTQRSSTLLNVEERCVTTLKTAVYQTTCLCVEIMNSRRQANGKLGHVVQIRDCRLTYNVNVKGMLCF